MIYQRLIILVLLASLAGCGIFKSTSSVRVPAELKKYSYELDPKSVWRVNTGAGNDDEFFRLAPMQTEANLITIDRDGLLSVLEKNSGKQLWKQKTGLKVRTGANGNDAVIVIGNTSGDINAYSMSEGASLWTVNVNSEVTAISRAVEDSVIVRTKNGYIHSLDINSGENLWSINRQVPDLSLHTQSIPLIKGDKVLVGLDNGQLLALSLKDGKVLWERAIATGRGRTELDRMVDIDGHFVVENDLIYVITFQGNVSAVNIEAGDVIWTKEASSISGVSVDDERVYFTDSDDQVHALDKNLGESFWKQEDMQYRALTLPVVHGDYLVVGDYDGYLHWLAKDDGRVVAREKAGGSILTAPFVENDRLYVLNSKGSLSMWELPAQ